MKKSLLIAIVVFVSFSSCRMINGRKMRGDGTVTTQTRNVKGFDAVKVSSNIDVYLRQDSSFAVRVEVDGNLQEYIDVYVDGSTLHIRPAKNTNLDATGDIKVYVSAPSYHNIDASGACNVFSENRISSGQEIGIGLSGACNVRLDLNAPKIGVDMSGACKAELTGQTKDLIVDGSGSTDLEAFGLLAETVDVDLSGAGEAEVYASVKLDASTSGAANVQYKGAGTVNSSVSGAGTVKKVD